jgi:hypothetical protein
MPSRTIKESHRRRVSDRTMHCHSWSGQSSGLLFQKTMAPSQTAKWNHRGEPLMLCFAGEDKAKQFAWRRPLSE